MHKLCVYTCIHTLWYHNANMQGGQTYRPPAHPAARPQPHTTRTAPSQGSGCGRCGRAPGSKNIPQENHNAWSKPTS